jgi:hypothetical protein
MRHRRLWLRPPCPVQPRPLLPSPPRCHPSCLRSLNWCLMCCRSAWFPSLLWFILTDADSRGYRLSLTQALHYLHSLSRSKVSSGHPHQSSLADGYGGRVCHSHVQRHLGLGSAPPRLQSCCRQVDLQTQVQDQLDTQEVQGSIGSS